MSPMLGGGEMVATVGRNHVEYAPAPHKFEAGTPPILEAIGLVAALDYIESVGRSSIAAHEAALGRHARARFAAIPHHRLWRYRKARSDPDVCLCQRPCRSEEHTSELQSLMRISYAVFS